MEQYNVVRVSYIISTKNRAKFLSKTLQNIREFITPKDELIVIDGGSNDNTLDVINSNMDIIKIFISESDNGEANGFNKGLIMSRGTFVKLITDDDYTFPDAIRLAVNKLEEDESIDALICGGEHCKFNNDKELVTDFYFHLNEENATNVGKPLSELGNAAGPGLSIIFRRKAIAIVGLLNTSFLCSDTEFVARMKQSKIKIKYFDVKLYRHIDYPHSAVMNKKKTNRDAVRIFVMYGAWSEAMKYEVEEIADALSININNGGREVLKTIQCLEQIRQWKHKKVSVLVLSLIMQAAKIVLTTKKIVDKLRKKNNERQESKKTTNNEPKWQERLM